MAEARKELGQAAAALAGSSAVARYEPLDRPAVDALLEQAAQLADPPARCPDSSWPCWPRAGRWTTRCWPPSLPMPPRCWSGSLTAWTTIPPSPTASCARARRPCRWRRQPKARLNGSVPWAAPDLSLPNCSPGVVRDCICAAFNPPCAPCEDTDVLLACLEVCDCTVVRICNAERDYVVSGSALRYWLPTGLLHQGLESFCCCAERGRDVARAEPGRLAFAEAGFGAGEPVAAAPWDLLGLPNPGHMLRDAMERAGAARAAPAVPEPPPEADGADAGATAQQVAALAERVAELTERLTQAQARLDKTEAELGETQAELRRTQHSLSALGVSRRRTRRPRAGRVRGNGAQRPVGSPPPASRSRRGQETATSRQALMEVLRKRRRRRRLTPERPRRTPARPPGRTHRRPAMTPERPAFFEGQILAAADLTSAVDYGRAEVARHERYLHDWGIAEGLELTQGQDRCHRKNTWRSRSGPAWRSTARDARSSCRGRPAEHDGFLHRQRRLAAGGRELPDPAARNRHRRARTAAGHRRLRGGQPADSHAGGVRPDLRRPRRRLRP